MIVYLVTNHSEGERKFVGTLAEAKGLKARYRAKHYLSYPDDFDYAAETFEVTIEKINYDTDKESILSILNYEGGYSKTIKEIA